MKAKEFIQKYLNSAIEIANKYELNAIGILAQAALESGWGKFAPRYNFFGMTCSSNYPNKQLLKTTEYFSDDKQGYKFPKVERIVYDSSSGKYKYTVYRYFRAYNNAAEAFEDYAQNIKSNRTRSGLRYRRAFQYHEPRFYKEYLTAIAQAGYATGTKYIQSAISVANNIVKYTGLNIHKLSSSRTLTMLLPIGIIALFALSKL